jgi:opacity protein-like surface antigen
MRVVMLLLLASMACAVDLDNRTDVFSLQAVDVVRIWSPDGLIFGTGGRYGEGYAIGHWYNTEFFMIHFETPETKNFVTIVPEPGTLLLFLGVFLKGFKRCRLQETKW